MWPGAVHWPDFLDNKATDGWWARHVEALGRDVGGVDGMRKREARAALARAPPRPPYPLSFSSGIWLDMNEVSNFCSGDACAPAGGVPLASIPPNNNFICLLDCRFGPNASGSKAKNAPPPSVYDPPYRINNAGAQRNVSEKTIAVTARHANGALEIDAHNLYGHFMAKSTYAALKKATGRRPFLFSRSTFLGTGAFGGHWTGDTSSSWRDLSRLTPAVLASGLAGTPFVGGDIGGFMVRAGGGRG
jgi:alpha-glucosidase (family GH31 glycosyl hydrolase)